MSFSVTNIVTDDNTVNTRTDSSMNAPSQISDDAASMESHHLRILSSDLIQYILSFVSLIHHHFAKCNNNGSTFIDWYGYLRQDDASCNGSTHKQVFLWCGWIHIPVCTWNQMIHLLHVLLPRDVPRISIQELCLLPHHSLDSILPLQSIFPPSLQPPLLQTHQSHSKNNTSAEATLVHNVLSRVKRLRLVRQIHPQLLHTQCLPLRLFTNLKALHMQIPHTMNNIERAYSLFTSLAFASLPLTELVICLLRNEYGSFKRCNTGEDGTDQAINITCTENEMAIHGDNDELDPMIHQPPIIRPGECFLIPQSKTENVTVGNKQHQDSSSSSALCDTTTSSRIIHSCIYSGMFGAIGTALLHNTGIHILQLDGFDSLPLWDDMERDARGRTPWMHLDTIRLYDVDCHQNTRILMLQLPMLKIYEERPYDSFILFDDAIQQSIEQSPFLCSVSFHGLITGIVDHAYVLKHLIPNHVIKQFTYEHNITVPFFAYSDFILAHMSDRGSAHHIRVHGGKDDQGHPCAFKTFIIDDDAYEMVPGIEDGVFPTILPKDIIMDNEYDLIEWHVLYKEIDQQNVASLQSEQAYECLMRNRVRYMMRSRHMLEREIRDVAERTGRQIEKLSILHEDEDGVTIDEPNQWTWTIRIRIK